MGLVAQHFAQEAEGIDGARGSRTRRRRIAQHIADCRAFYSDRRRPPASRPRPAASKKRPRKQSKNREKAAERQRFRRSGGRRATWRKLNEHSNGVQTIFSLSGYRAFHRWRAAEVAAIDARASSNSLAALEAHGRAQAGEIDADSARRAFAAAEPDAASLIREFKLHLRRYGAKLDAYAAAADSATNRGPCPPWPAR